MNHQQDKRAEMQAKLSEGLKILASASQEDLRSLNDALLKIHAALEDFVRMELAAKAPHLREEVENKRTTWKKLIEYSRQHLGFSENDIQLITEANDQRRAVAHGGNYSGSLSELVTYAGFVQKWVERGKAAPVEFRPRPVSQAPGTYPLAPPQPPVYPGNPGTPWYRSGLFLFLCLLLPPLWAVMILTDRSQGAFARLIAGALLLAVSAGVIGVAANSWSSSAEAVPDRRDPTPASEAPVAVNTEPPAQPAAATQVACTIVWEEHLQDDLGGKNRSMLWREIVEPQVQGSGMTPREFFDQVVEQNPDLVTNGYVFETGKTYLLPSCG